MTVVTANCTKQKMARLHQLAGNDEHAFRAMDRILARTFVRELLRRRARQPASPPIAGPRTYQPRMDMCDDPSTSRIVAMLELPGLKQEDLSVRIEDDQLLIQGERRFRSLAPPRSPSAPAIDEGAAAVARAEASGLPRGYTAQEIKYGRFSRALPLPPGTHAEQVQAELSEGMLTVSWPRHPNAEPFAPAADRSSNSQDVLTAHAE